MPMRDHLRSKIARRSLTAAAAVVTCSGLLLSCRAGWLGT